MAVQAKKLQAAKTAAIADIKARFEKSSDYIFTEYRGLTVAQISDLRRQLREKGCSYKVVKNNFARIAFEEMKAGDVASYLTGPTAVALAGEESGAAAKILFDFSKEVPALVSRVLLSAVRCMIPKKSRHTPGFRERRSLFRCLCPPCSEILPSLREPCRPLRTRRQNKHNFYRGPGFRDGVSLRSALSYWPREKKGLWNVISADIADRMNRNSLLKEKLIWQL